MSALDHWLRTAPLGGVLAALLAQNVAVFVLALVGGHAVARWFAHRPVAAPPDPLGGHEVALAAWCVVMNTLVTVGGLALFRAGLIRPRDELGPRVLLDLVVLALAMDLAMYLLHRVAHTRWLYGWLHRPHHRYERTRPLTLFVLSPLEVLGFGALWLAVCVAYPATWAGMALYLAFNVLWGVLGHVGVEPFPAWWVRLPVARAVATSTFHAQHHAEPACNFGFYTLLWDRLFGTLAADYVTRFERAATATTAAAAAARPARP